MKFYVEANIKKSAMSGEGSRGGHVIGHTKSGKPVYEVGFHHPSVSKFSDQDHKDAKRLHIGYAEYLDPHPEDGGGAFYNEGGEKFDPAHNPENGEKRAKFHLKQANLHGDKVGATTANTVHHPYVERAEVFVIDVMKAIGTPRANHKYIRRYRRGDSWIYVYHEPDQHGRAIPNEDIAIIHKLAAAGHKDSKDFLENVHDHNEEELKILRALADKGHAPSKALLKEYGIDREMEKVEEASVPTDKLLRTLHADEKEKALQAVKDSAKRMYDRFASHPNSHFETTARTAGITLESIVDSVKDKENLKDMLTALNEKMIELDRAHGTRESSYDAAKAAGGYGNMIYNDAVTRMQEAGVLPANYNTAHKRTRANAASLEPHLESEHKVKMALAEDERRRAEEARVERERAERERREAEERAAHAELEGSMASFMNSLLESPKSASETLALHRSLKNIFGMNLRKENFPYNFEAQGIKTKIESLSVSGENIGLKLAFYKNGQRITSECRRSWDRSGGRPHIHNSYLTVPDHMRDGTNVSNFINKGQRDLLRACPEGGRITVNANIDIGGYTWANCGFSTSEMGDLRSEFKSFLRGKGITLTDAEWATFKDPVHIAQFDIGVKTIKTMEARVPLSRKQIETKSISGVEGQHPLTEAEIASGKSNRIAMSVGKEFLLRGGGRSWQGYWDTRMDNEATRFADHYYALRDRAVKHLSPEYQATISRAKSGRAAAPQVTPTPVVAATAPAAARSSTPASTEIHEARKDNIRYLGRGWKNSAGKIAMTMRRVHALSQWPEHEREFFISEFRSSLTRDAIRKIRSTTPEQARAQRTESRNRRRDTVAANRRARRAAASSPAPTSTSDRPLIASTPSRATRFAGYNTTHGEAIERILNSDHGQDLGHSFVWYKDNNHYLNGEEKAKLKEFFNRRAETAKIIVNNLISRNMLPESYKTMTPNEQKEAFAAKFRNPAGFTSAGGTQHEYDGLTDFLNVSMYHDNLNEINEGQAAA